LSLARITKVAKPNRTRYPFIAPELAFGEIMLSIRPKGENFATPVQLLKSKSKRTLAILKKISSLLDSQLANTSNPLKPRA
jgi:hypothetical protein